MSGVGIDLARFVESKLLQNTARRHSKRGPLPTTARSLPRLPK